MGKETKGPVQHLTPDPRTTAWKCVLLYLQVNRWSRDQRGPVQHLKCSNRVLFSTIELTVFVFFNQQVNPGGVGDQRSCSTLEVTMFVFFNQQVNPGGVGDRCGLKAGDAVLRINDKPSDELEHEAAKYEILRSGNQVSMLIQRCVLREYSVVTQRYSAGTLRVLCGFSMGLWVLCGYSLRGHAHSTMWVYSVGTTHSG